MNLFNFKPAIPYNRAVNVAYVLLWLPSQKGGFLVFLQPHNETAFFSSMVNFSGVKSVPLCEPSHKGWLFDLPQLHQ